MRASTILAVSIVVLANLIMRSEAHGRLLVPPARSSAWREDPARFPTYFDDAQMFCGGFQTQWGVNGMSLNLKKRDCRKTPYLVPVTTYVFFFYYLFAW
jgi:hypothetical protein